MIDAECQQLHNGNYRFDGSINGGINGVFGFSGDWGYFWGLSLDFLSRTLTGLQAWEGPFSLLAWLRGGRLQLVFRAILRIFSVWANIGVGQRYFCLLYGSLCIYRFN